MDNYRILVIDDIAAIHQDFNKILKPEKSESRQRLDEMSEKLFGKQVEKKQLPPFTIDSAYQGQEGVELVTTAVAEKKPYAVAFVDVQMPPGDDGVETISKIWQIDSEIQIVICTAYAKYSWEDLMKRFGENDRLFILKKPFDNMEIIQLALSLTKKWNLNQSINDQLSKLKKEPSLHESEMDKSMRTMKETVKALEAVNQRLMNRNQKV